MIQKLFAGLLIVTALGGCATLGTVLQDMNSGSGGPLTNSEIVQGLKEALRVGIDNGAGQASQVNGYFGNALIKILMPPEAQKVENALRQIGLGKEVDKFILSLNRAAEDAAKKAKPIFFTAITSMTIQDALGILNGSDTAATAYLRRTSGVALFNSFYPVVDSTLQLNQATRYYSDIVNTYNKIPFVQKVDPDLKRYATNKAIDGLFTLVADEERKIRKDPVARVTQILKRVFGGQSNTQNAAPPRLTPSNY
ncbi:DUF4197 domain-containing protein [Ravibacter arvi]|uniref:DUF4197 domain-containing protein n=1 Tax=Ravibacter arvi TaxID=2051041 RepID=A0ABP8LPB0_9BACT